jgi:hypothetical protein
MVEAHALEASWTDADKLFMREALQMVRSLDDIEQKDSPSKRSIPVLTRGTWLLDALSSTLAHIVMFYVIWPFFHSAIL